MLGLGLGCLTPLSTIFQLYRGDKTTLYNDSNVQTKLYNNSFIRRRDRKIFPLQKNGRIWLCVLLILIFEGETAALHCNFKMKRTRDQTHLLLRIIILYCYKDRIIILYCYKYRIIILKYYVKFARNLILCTKLLCKDKPPTASKLTNHVHVIIHRGWPPLLTLSLRRRICGERLVK
jgi:hypothetical protein